MRTNAGDSHYIAISCSDEGEERLLTVYKDGEVFTALRYRKGGKEETYILPVPEGSEAEAEDSLTFLKERPERKKPPFAFHYAPEKGWINDPNGLILHSGLYHLYYQHNPLSKEWGNMSWGHAVSKDLVSWEEQDPVFLPEDKDHVIYSGSAYEENGKLAVYYTLWDTNDDSANVVLRKESADGFAFSGRSELLPHAGEAARDPKVFEWKGSRYIVIYLDGHDYGLYKEEDGEWKLSDRFSAAPGWECPNVLSFSDRLYFFTAEGYCWEAEIEGGRMKLKGERRNLFLTSLPYASQVFANTPGRQILIPWLRAKTPSLPSTGCLGIPRKVVEKDGKLALVPVMEVLESLRLRPFVRSNEVRTEEGTCFIFFQDAGSFSGKVNGNRIEYDRRTLRVNDEEVPLSSSELVLMADGLLLEASAEGYTENAFFELNEGKGTVLSSPEPMTGAIGVLRSARQSIK